jgi:cytochrome P450
MRLLRRPDLSSDMSSPGFPIVDPTHAKWNAGFLRMDPPEHDVYRRMLAPEFSVKKVERLRVQITESVDRLFDEMMAAGPGVDLVDALGISVPALVICALLGVPYQHREYFVECVDTFLGGGSAEPAESQRAQNEINELLHNVIRTKRSSPEDDLLSRLVCDYVDTGQLTEDMLVSIALLILGAGFDTTTNMIGLGTVALLENPEQYAALRSDPSLVVAGVEELLRYLNPPQWGRFRAALADIEVDGQVIRSGEGIIMALDIANRDPEQFEDPNTFDLTKGKRPHLAFGVGIHQCLGATLARLELQLVFTTMAERMPNLQMMVPLEDLSFKTNYPVYGVNALPVSW